MDNVIIDVTIDFGKNDVIFAMTAIQIFHIGFLLNLNHNLLKSKWLRHKNVLWRHLR